MVPSRNEDALQLCRRLKQEDCLRPAGASVSTNHSGREEPTLPSPGVMSLYSRWNEGEATPGQDLQVTATWPSSQASGFALPRVRISSVSLSCTLFCLGSCVTRGLCVIWPRRLWQIPLSSPERMARG